MKDKQVTVSIGIPAYNEEGNIKKLLDSLLSQQRESFSLLEIIVVSDGSTDNTTKIIKDIKTPFIKLIDKPEREGKVAALNTIFQMSQGDILVSMDADISLNKDVNFLERFISQIQKEELKIATVKTLPVPGSNLLENSLNFSILIQDKIRSRWNDSDNYLSFRGSCIGIHSELVKRIIFPSGLTNDDAFIYFRSKELGYTAKCFNNCVVYYRSPARLGDYANQAIRFRKSQEELEKYIDKSVLCYEIPRNILLKALFSAFISHPLYFISYLVFFSLSRIKTIGKQNVQLRQMATSTKSI